MTERTAGRAADACARCSIQRRYTMHAEGSVLVAFGATKVLCTASVDERVPPHKRGSGEGWVTAEYGMLPRATHTRGDREAARGKQSGRTQEIQRLIGRSLRAVFDLSALGERTIHLDCDVLQADGGTRTAAITGAFVAAARRRAAGCSRRAASRPARSATRGGGVGGHRQRCAAARPGLRRGFGLRHRHERRDDGQPAASSRCRARPRACPSRAPRWTRCWAWPTGASASSWPRSAPRWPAEGRAPCAWCWPPTTPRSCANCRRCSARACRLELVAQGALGIVEAEEPHASFVENALAKARHAARAAGCRHWPTTPACA
jgi:hypothetical protein